MKKILLFSMLLIFVFAVGVSAADYPNDTVRIIVGWSAGGGSDILARTVAPYLEKYLGVSVIVENMPGAAGEVSFTHLQNVKPDGYTIGVTNIPVFFSPVLMREVKYNWRDFRPLANVVTDPAIIAVKADDDRFPDIETFLEYAEKNPKTITISNTGVGSTNYVANLMLELEAGIEFRNVPYEGAGPSNTALLGGHVDAVGNKIGEIAQFLDSGQMKLLAVMSDERLKDYPDIPTFKELGYDVVMSSSRGMSAPPGTPDEIVVILGEAFEKATSDPEFLAQAKKLQFPLNIQLLDDYKEMRDNMFESFKKLYEQAPW